MLARCDVTKLIVYKLRARSPIDQLGLCGCCLKNGGRLPASPLAQVKTRRSETDDRLAKQWVAVGVRAVSDNLPFSEP